MTDYFSNFIQHTGQIDSFLAAATVWVGFFAIGSFFLGKSKLYETAPFLGWAVVNFIFTILGVFTSIPFAWIAYGVGGVALIALIVALRREDRLLPAGTLKVLILAAPLLLLVSAMIGSQWDEFSDWLISPRLMLETGSFPTRADAYRSGSLAAYPYGWHYVSYLASVVAGRFLENAGALVNVFMLLTFGFVSIRLVRTGLGRSQDVSSPAWSLCAIGMLSTTLLNTTFAQKVALTSYADVATGTVTGLGAVVGWYMLGALAEGRRRDAFLNALQVGLLMMLLVNLKQSTVVMFVLVIAAVLLAGLRDPKVKLRDLLAMVPGMTVPAVVIFFVWRYYVGQELSINEMSVRPISGWYFNEAPQILERMLLVLSKKGAYLILLVAIIGFSLRAMIKCHTPFDRFAIIAGALFLGHNAFLFFAYLSTFGLNDALRAASYWRYNMQLGLVGVAFTAYGAGTLWQKYMTGRTWPQRMAWLPVFLIVATPFFTVERLRFDRAPPVPHYRSVASDLRNMLTEGDALSVLDPQGTGESAVITRYELGGRGIYKSYLSAFQKVTEEQLRTIFANGNYSHLLVHSMNSTQQAVLGLELAENVSYLLAADGTGGWRIIKSWPKP